MPFIDEFKPRIDYYQGRMKEIRGLLNDGAYVKNSAIFKNDLEIVLLDVADDMMALYKDMFNSPFTSPINESKYKIAEKFLTQLSYELRLVVDFIGRVTR